MATHHPTQNRDLEGSLGGACRGYSQGDAVWETYLLSAGTAMGSAALRLGLRQDGPRRTQFQSQSHLNSSLIQSPEL